MTTCDSQPTTPRVGASVVEISPHTGTPMAGFAARTGPSTGVHDPLTVRALVVEDTCWITVDVCGLHEDTCTLIARGMPLAPERIAITATHTHSGPCVVPGRLGGHDPQLLAEIVAACRHALEAAVAGRKPAILRYGQSSGVGIAKNRRHPERSVDPPVQTATYSQPDGKVIAWLILYPCHPVVLGPENRLISADFPGFTRKVLEAQSPGSIALFLPGTAGDINTGHPATASYKLSASPDRTIEQARRVGEQLASSILATSLLPIPGESDSITATTTSATRRTLNVRMETRDAAAPQELSRLWSAEAATADRSRKRLLNAWQQWASARSPREPMTWPASVSVFRWGGMSVIGLPGEPFLATAEAITSQVKGPSLVTGYTNGCPGYFPTSDEYRFGGYEVEDAHRYYGMPAPFAPGSAEILTRAAIELFRELQ